jgi:hypothetical protein
MRHVIFSLPTQGEATMLRFGQVLMLSLLVLVLAACGGGGGASGSPEDAAKGFMESFAALDAERAAGFLCEAQAEQADQLTEGFEGTEGITIDVTGLTYTASNVTDTTATVTIGGNMVVSAAGQSQEMPVDTLFPEFPVVVENGAWKICPTDLAVN